MDPKASSFEVEDKLLDNRLYIMMCQSIPLHAVYYVYDFLIQFILFDIV